MAKNIQPTIETGAMTLVLLVNNYRSQMIALLLKNGVAVPDGYSSQQIASLMANLLKVSKSFFTDLNTFIQNPKVMQILTDGMNENAQYFKASGSGFAGKKQGNAQYLRASGYMNSTGGEDGFTDTGVPAPSVPSVTPVKTGFLANLNLGNLLSQGLGAFGQYDKNKTDRAIAEAQASFGGYTPSGTKTGTGTDTDTKEEKAPDAGLSTTLVVVLGLVGIAVLGTVIYFVARPKK